MSSKSDLPNEAEIIIIGGGIVGCSIAYHLAKKGVKDVVLIERKQLTCGTTWHAAGLVSMLWPTPTLTNLAKYCHEYNLMPPDIFVKGGMQATVKSRKKLSLLNFLINENLKGKLLDLSYFTYRFSLTQIKVQLPSGSIPTTSECAC